MKNRNVISLRLIAVAIAALFALVPAGRAVAAADGPPDTAVTRVTRFCNGDSVAIVNFGLRNFGDERRAYRARMVRSSGWTVTQLGYIRPGKRASVRVWSPQGEHVRVVIRSQGRTIMRAELFGDCPSRQVS